MSPPHLGIFFAKKISRALSRNWRIQSGSFFISEIWLTISASSPLRARKTGFESVWKSYLLISPMGSAGIVGLRISVDIKIMTNDQAPMTKQFQMIKFECLKREVAPLWPLVIGVLY